MHAHPCGLVHSGSTAKYAISRMGNLFIDCCNFNAHKGQTSELVLLEGKMCNIASTVIKISKAVTRNLFMVIFQLNPVS